MIDLSIQCSTPEAFGHWIKSSFFKQEIADVSSVTFFKVNGYLSKLLLNYFLILNDIEQVIITCGGNENAKEICCIITIFYFVMFR